MTEAGIASVVPRLLGTKHQLNFGAVPILIVRPTFDRCQSQKSMHTMMVWPIWLQHNWRQRGFLPRARDGRPDVSVLVGVYQNQGFECAGRAKAVELAARLPPPHRRITGML